MSPYQSALEQIHASPFAATSRGLCKLIFSMTDERLNYSVRECFREMDVTGKSIATEILIQFALNQHDQQLQVVARELADMFPDLVSTAPARYMPTDDRRSGGERRRRTIH
jgi:hypothetical protein